MPGKGPGEHELLHNDPPNLLRASTQRRVSRQGRAQPRSRSRSERPERHRRGWVQDTCLLPSLALVWADGGRSHVSGSAYKIVNKRAYHHGTMLIDAKLDQLGEVLHNTKVRPPLYGFIRPAQCRCVGWTGHKGRRVCSLGCSEFGDMDAGNQPRRVRPFRLGGVYQDVRRGWIGLHCLRS